MYYQPSTELSNPVNEKEDVTQMNQLGHLAEPFLVYLLLVKEMLSHLDRILFFMKLTFSLFEFR